MDNNEEKIRYINRKWRTRRRMAISSFISVVCMVWYYLATPLFLTSEQADILSEFNGVITTGITFLIGLVMLYVGAATTEDIKNKN